MNWCIHTIIANLIHAWRMADPSAIRDYCIRVFSA